MDNMRTLRADEIECRVAMVKRTNNGVGCSLLLYKDARCDMTMLDELYGAMNWQREHVIIDGRLYCNISVWDDKKKQWICKQDVGTESNTEKEKGQASDSFKRAGTNWGIGRELYTSPFIWIGLKDNEYAEKQGKLSCRQKFSVKEISYSDSRKIIHLVILDKDGNERYRFENGEEVKPEKTESDKKSAQETAQTEKHSDKTATQKTELVGEVEIETLKKVVKALGGATKNEFERITGVKFCDIGKMTKTDWGKLMVELNKQMDTVAHQRAMQHDA